MAADKELTGENKSTVNLSRRKLLQTGTMGAVAGAVASVSLPGLTYSQSIKPGTNPERTLLKGGTVITIDRALGDFAEADVLMEGSSIAAIGRNLAVGDAKVVPAGNMIVMPGFIDTHRHLWYGQFRHSSPSGNEYLINRNRYGPLYRPEDAYAGDTVSIYSALDAGVTTILDWSHIQISPAHSDAVVHALKDSGIRAVYCYGWPQPGYIPWWKNSTSKFPHDIRRLRKQYFSSDDQLVTLAMGPTSKNHAKSWLETNPEQIKQEWAVAREIGARISFHTSGKGNILRLAKHIPLGADTTYVHCRDFTQEEFKMIADSGGTVSLAPTVDSLPGRGICPINDVLEAGIRPSLSVDEEMDAGNDLFTQMRTVIVIQRGTLRNPTHPTPHTGASDVGPDRDNKVAPSRLLTAREALEFATIEGARANGLEKKTGSLTVGKEADIIMLRKDRINVMPLNDPVGAVVLAMDTGNVDSVFVAGKAKKLNGQLVGVDLKKVADQAIQSREYLMSKAKLVESQSKTSK